MIDRIEDPQRGWSETKPLKSFLPTKASARGQTMINIRNFKPNKLPFWTWGPLVVVCAIGILPNLEGRVVKKMFELKPPASPNPYACEDKVCKRLLDRRRCHLSAFQEFMVLTSKTSDSASTMVPHAQPHVQILP